MEEVFREVTLKSLKCPRICEELFSATQMHRTQTAEPRGGCANRRLCSRDVPTLANLLILPTHLSGDVALAKQYGGLSSLVSLVVLNAFSPSEVVHTHLATKEFNEMP